MSVLHILVGLSASGKSTWCKRELNSICGAVVFSSDTIRKELFGSEEEQGNPSEVFNLMFKRTCTALREKTYFNVYYDATNLSRKRRMGLIKEIRKNVDDVIIMAHVFATPFETCCERNNARPRHVPDDVMARMYRSFQIPSIEEGFDNISIERTCEVPFGVLEEKISAYCHFDQNNPHHSLTVGEHCLAAEHYIKRNWHYMVWDIGYYLSHCVCVAALYHDIGKPYCATKVKRNGQVDDFTHYYCHENCGAYDFLSYADQRQLSQAQILTISLLINLHMVHYGDKVFQNRMRELYGEKFWKALEWLWKADKSAH